MISLERLNQTHDLQAVGTSARAIFEHYLDLKWLQTFPEEEWFRRFREFVDVESYLAAKKVVDHKRLNATSKINNRIYNESLERIQRMDSAEPMCARVLRVWRDKRGEPQWPRGHWTGEGNLRERAKAIGPEYEDGYIEIYPTLCALVHAGPSPEHGDGAWREKLAGFGYFYSFLYAKRATETIMEMLDIDEPVLRYEYSMQSLDRWATEAIGMMPPVPQNGES